MKPPEGIAMSTLTLRLPENLALRLKSLAHARGLSVNKLVNEIIAQTLAAYDTETRFKAMAAQANILGALAALDRMDQEAE
jgi:predicted DNA-binding protein